MLNNSSKKHAKKHAMSHCFETCCICGRILSTADIFICEKRDIKDKVCSKHIIGEDFPNRATYVVKKTIQWLFPYFILFEMICSCFLIFKNRISQPILVFNYLIAGVGGLSIFGITIDIIFLLLGLIGIAFGAVSFVSKGLFADVREYGFKKLDEYDYPSVSYSISEYGVVDIKSSTAHHYDFGGRILNLFLFFIYLIFCLLISFLGIVFYVISLVSFFRTHPFWTYNILDKVEKNLIIEGEYISNIQDKEAKSISIKINKEYYYLSNKEKTKKYNEIMKDRYYYIKVDKKICPIISIFFECTSIGNTNFQEIYLVLEKVDGLVSAKAYFVANNRNQNKIKLVEARFNKDAFSQWGNLLLDLELEKSNLTNEILVEIYNKRMSYMKMH